MRHNRDEKRFNRTSEHLKAMLCNMAVSLFNHGRIETTLPKAKELRRFAERLITIGKKGDLHARRRAFAYLKDRTVVKKLFDEIAPRYRDRNGGYTRILRTGNRRGDCAPMAIIELVEGGAVEKAPSQVSEAKTESF